MPTKPFYQSTTIWSAALLFLLNQAQLHGIKLDDLVAPLSASLAKLISSLPPFVDAVMQFILLVTAIVGRVTAKHDLTLKPEAGPAPIRGLMLVLGACAIGALSGCGGANISPNGLPAATTIEASLPLIRTGASVATGAVLNFAITDSTERKSDANKMYSAADGIYTLLNGQFPSVAKLQKTILDFGGTQADANYAQFSTAIANLYSAYYAKAIASGDTKSAVDLLNAIAAGIQDATKSYVQTPVAAAPTSAAPLLFVPLPVARDSAGLVVYSF